MSIFANGESSYNERLKNFITRLENKYPTLEYVSGYIDSDKPVIVKCKQCGYEFKVSAQCIREKHHTSCKNCIRLDKKINNYKDKVINKYKLDINRSYKELFKYIKRNTYYITECKLCGLEIISKNKRHICSKCISKYDKHHSSKSLKKLYEKENGICYICNKQCDYNDYIIKDNIKICGNYYPSIDHLKPLCNGGTDNWDNLRLAHRICNSYKSVNERS